MSREGYAPKLAGCLWPCEEPGCAARGNAKRFCPDHIDRLPYVQQLVAEISKGAVDTVPTECGTCGEVFGLHKSVSLKKSKPTCPPCRMERDKAKDRRRQQSKRRAS